MKPYKSFPAIALILAIFFFSGCAELRDITIDSPPTVRIQPETLGLNATDGEVLIASWNIQTFGPTKAGRPEVMAVIADTITLYDIVAIQEIRDASGTAMVVLEEAVDSLGIDYSVVIGPRLGRSQIKEQYAYIYRSDRFTLIDSFTIADPDDVFHREPFVAWFARADGGKDVAIMTIHVDPDEAKEEIEYLEIAGEGFKNNIPDAIPIILGDLNADCDYYDIPFVFSGYQSIISDEMDTNVAPSSCTYDRILVADEWSYYVVYGGVYRFDQILGLNSSEAKSISDHYPVFVGIAADTTE